MNKQQLLDEHIEPQSMTYQLEGLIPTRSLLVREKAFDEVAPDFFTTGKRLLDVGCAKGYFSLLFTNNRETVSATGIDYNPEAIKLCDNLRDPINQQLVFVNVSFRDLPLIDTYYDRIFIGNGPHYMFMGSGGNWDWIDKLAVLSTDLVLMEGGFNFEDPQMKEYFDILKKVPSPVTGRYIVLLKKKQNLPTFKEVQLYDLPIDHAFRLGWKEHSTLFLTRLEIDSDPEDASTMYQTVFAKIYPIGCRPQALQLASLSKHCSSIKAIIKFGDQYAGCCEVYYNHPEWGQAADLIDVVRISCEHQIFLAKQGHIDIDIARGNVLARRGSGEIIVDKNQIYPTKPLDERHAKLWQETLQNPELGLDIQVGLDVTEAILSCDSVKIEQVFRKVLNLI
jgi:SAM-dependent methyltransferase